MFLSRKHTAIPALALIMAFRIFGLFMIMPVFSLYLKHIPDATPALIGLAIGIYGLTQALFQIPFGLLSDRWGRKPIITAGLALFAIGSICAALSHSIYGMVLGRALQGAGAIGSAVLAMAADLTPDKSRAQTMAIIGAAIGVSFAIALIIGPAINAVFHLSGIFWATAGFALIGMMLLYTLVPTPTRSLPHPDVEPKPNYFKKALTQANLLPLDFGIFALHAMMAALFISVPMILAKTLVTPHQQVWLYCLVLLLAFIVALPMIRMAERKRKIKLIFISAIILLILSQLLLLILLLIFSPAAMPVIYLALLLWLFFSAFTVLEACLPSLVSKLSPIHTRGTAMGIYSSCQYAGIFIGGSVGGWIFGHFNFAGTVIFGVLLGLAWLLLTFTMPTPIAQLREKR